MLATRKIFRFIIFDFSIKLAPILATVASNYVVGGTKMSSYITGAAFSATVSYILNMSLGDRKRNPAFIDAKSFFFIYLIVALSPLILYKNLGYMFCLGFVAVQLISNPYSSIVTIQLNKSYVWIYVLIKSLTLNAIPALDNLFLSTMVCILNLVLDCFLYKKINSIPTISTSYISEMVSAGIFSLPLIVGSFIEYLYFRGLTGSSEYAVVVSSVLLRVNKSVAQSIINFNVYSYGRSFLKFEGVLLAITCIISVLVLQYYTGYLFNGQVIKFISVLLIVIICYFIYIKNVKRSRS